MLCLIMIITKNHNPSSPLNPRSQNGEHDKNSIDLTMPDANGYMLQTGELWQNQSIYNQHDDNRLEGNVGSSPKKEWEE